MAFVVVYDACILYPAPLRDFLIRVAQTGMVQAKWTEEILDECFENILEDRPDLSSEALARTRQLMNVAVRDCLVRGYEALEEGVELPDPGDRHVLAAAIRAGAQTIVTWNLRDFPDEALAQLGIQAQSPDLFAIGLLELNFRMVLEVLDEQRNSLREPRSRAEILATLRQNGLNRFVDTLAQLGWA